MCMAVYVYVCVSQEKACYSAADLLLHVGRGIRILYTYTHTYLHCRPKQNSHTYTYVYLHICMYSLYVRSLMYSSRAENTAHFKGKNHFLHWNSALKSNEGMNRAKKKTKINPTDREILEF